MPGKCCQGVNMKNDYSRLSEKRKNQKPPLPALNLKPKQKKTTIWNPKANDAVNARKKLDYVMLCTYK